LFHCHALWIDDRTRSHPIVVHTSAGGWVYPALYVFVEAMGSLVVILSSGFSAGDGAPFIGKCVSPHNCRRRPVGGLPGSTVAPTLK